MGKIADIRPSPIAGRGWYEGDARKLARQVDEYLAKADEPELDGEVLALIAPHAGHVYSGATAGFANRLGATQTDDLAVELELDHGLGLADGLDLAPAIDIRHLLGVAIGSLANIFDPDVVIIGGGFGAAAADFVLEPARVAARAEAIEPADETLQIVQAELGDEAGLIGAGLVAFEALDGVR